MLGIPCTGPTSQGASEKTNRPEFTESTSKQKSRQYQTEQTFYEGTEDFAEKTRKSKKEGAKEAKRRAEEQRRAEEEDRRAKEEERRAKAEAEAQERKEQAKAEEKRARETEARIRVKWAEISQTLQAELMKIWYKIDALNDILKVMETEDESTMYRRGEYKCDLAQCPKLKTGLFGTSWSKSEDDALEERYTERALIRRKMIEQQSIYWTEIEAVEARREAQWQDEICAKENVPSETLLLYASERRSREEEIRSMKEAMRVEQDRKEAARVRNAAIASERRSFNQQNCRVSELLSHSIFNEPFETRVFGPSQTDSFFNTSYTSHPPSRPSRLRRVRSAGLGSSSYFSGGRPVSDINMVPYLDSWLLPRTISNLAMPGYGGMLGHFWTPNSLGTNDPYEDLFDLRASQFSQTQNPLGTTNPYGYPSDLGASHFF